MEEGLVGTQMSLVNTLTQRSLLEGSKLLFVADVMSALKKYGEVGAGGTGMRHMGAGAGMARGVRGALV